MTSATCRRTERHLSRLRDHASAEFASAAATRAHCAACSHCRHFADTLNLLDALNLPAPTSAPEAGTLAARALAGNRVTQSKTPRLPRPQWVIGTMAVSGIAVAGYLMRPVSPAPRLIVVRPPDALAAPVPRSAAPVTQQVLVSPRVVTIPPVPTTPLAAPLRAPALASARTGHQTLPKQIRLVPVKVTPRSTPHLATDDLAFINADPARVLNGWAYLSASDQAKLEAQTRASLAQGDGFVSVPFPRVASLGGARAVQDALAQFRREASIVDSRLQRSVSLQVKQESFAIFCEKLTRQTGVTFAADETVADDNLVLFCTNRTLRDILRQISHHFGYTWRREGEPGRYRYTLTQDLAAQIAEEELRNRDRADAILDVDRDMQKYRPYLHLSPDGIVQMRRKDYDEYFRDMKRFSKRYEKATPAEKKRLDKAIDEKIGVNLQDPVRTHIAETLFGPRWAAVQMYFRLNADQRASLRRGVTLRWSSLPQSDDLPLPPDIETGLRVALRDDYVVFSPDGKPAGFSTGQNSRLADLANPNYPPSASTFSSDGGAGYKRVRAVDAIPGATAVAATLELKEKEPGVWEVWGGSGFAAVASGKPDGMATTSQVIGVGSHFRSAQNASTLAMLPLAAKQKLTDQTIKMFSTAPTVTVSDAWMWLNDDGTPRLISDPRVTQADLLERLHKATNQDVLGDGYTRLFPIDKMPAIAGKTLPQALNLLCAATHSRWQASKGEGDAPWLLVRSAAFFNDRLREVPKAKWEAWAARRRERGYLGIDDLTEMASLPDAVLDSDNARKTAVGLYGLLEWELASTSNFRREWRFINRLSLEQKARLWSKPGLAFADLSDDMQNEYLRQKYGSGLSKYQRDLIVTTGKFTATYTTLPQLQKSYRAAPDDNARRQLGSPRVQMTCSFGDPKSTYGNMVSATGY